MSKRTERREAERLARKAAYQQLREQRAQEARPAESPNSATPSLKSAAHTSDQACAAQAVAIEAIKERINQSTDELSTLMARAEAFFETRPAFAPEPAPQLSEAQLTANRANAQLSRGPVTTAGKAISSQNSLKHGLTSKTVLLPGEDATEYQHQLDSYIEIFKPANDEELRLVQSQLDCIWRLDRIRRIETALLAKGHFESENMFEDREPKERAQLIRAEAYLKYERQIRNLNIQEARLRRTMEKDRAELHRLQTIRGQEELAAIQAQMASHQHPARPSNGFVFSTPPQAIHSEAKTTSSSTSDGLLRSTKAA